MWQKILVPFCFKVSLLNISHFDKYVPIYVLMMSGAQIYGHQNRIKGGGYK